MFKEKKLNYIFNNKNECLLCKMEDVLLMQIHDNPMDKGCDNQMTILPTNPKDCILSVCGKLITRTKTKEREGKENNFFCRMVQSCTFDYKK